jgi:hypothetical protein
LTSSANVPIRDLLDDAMTLPWLPKIVTMASIFRQKEMLPLSP